MAVINKTGITDSGIIQAEHVTRAIDALSGVGTDTIIATGSFSGSLVGALTGTASFATTASFALNAGALFPFTGSAIISGSLAVTGSTTVNGALRVNGRASTQGFRVDSNIIASTQTVDVGSSDCLAGGIHTLRLNDSGSITLNLLEPNLYEPGSAWSFTFRQDTPDANSNVIIQSVPTPPSITPSPNIWGSIVGFENGTGTRLSGVTLVSSSLGIPFPYCRIDLTVNDSIWHISVIDRYETDWHNE